MRKTKIILKFLSLYWAGKKNREQRTEVAPRKTDTEDSDSKPHTDVAAPATATTFETVVQPETPAEVITPGVTELSSGASYGSTTEQKEAILVNHTNAHSLSAGTDDMAEPRQEPPSHQSPVSATIPAMIQVPDYKVSDSDEEEIVLHTETVVSQSLAPVHSDGAQVEMEMADAAMSISSSPQMVYYAPGSTSTSILAKQIINVHGADGAHILFQDPKEMGRRALKLLSKYSNVDAELNSAARYPPPKCHPDTRKMLLNATKEWMINPKYTKRALWLYGTAGVGKSAFAQTLAEYARDNKMLGAVFFFSRPNRRNDPNTVFPTIARQLAIVNEDYKKEIGTILDASPHLLTCDFKVQFQKLIVEPLRQVHTEIKLLIILDGLDECKGEDNQCNIAESIIQLLKTPTNPLSVFWMICSRPEHHLKYLLHDKHTRDVCWVEELSVDAYDSKCDASVYIRSEFQRLKKKYSHIVEDDWPEEKLVSRIIIATQGHFASSTAIIRFIDDPTRPNPDAHLQIVSQIITDYNPDYKPDRNPMDLLDSLYRRILEDIPDDIIKDTLLLLHTIIWHFEGDVSRHMYVQDLANMLGMSRGRLYGAIGKIHSLIQLPEPVPGHLVPIAFNHASFHDFLMDPARSGRFAVDYEAIYPVLRRRAIEILKSDLTIPIHLLEPEAKASISVDLMNVFDRDILPWKYPPPARTDQRLAGKLVSLAMSAFYHLCTDEDVRKLDFNRLAYHDSFLVPVEGLTKLARPIDFNSQHDKKLLDLCLSTIEFSHAKPLPMTENNEIDEVKLTDIADEGGVYMFLGYNSNAIIAVLTTPWAQGFHFLFPISLYQPGEYWPHLTLLKSIPPKENYGKWGMTRRGSKWKPKVRFTPRFDTDSNFYGRSTSLWEDFC